MLLETSSGRAAARAARILRQWVVRTPARAVADEQAALRRVAELVARGVAQEEVFAFVAAEASRLIDGEATTLLRFDEADCATVIAVCRGPAPVGTVIRVSREDESTIAQVLRTGLPARFDDYTAVETPAYARRFRVRSSVAAPITVDERVWGLLGVTTPDRHLPEGAEQRLHQFAELIAAALANAQARAELQLLAREQAALRRVAELVAHGAPPEAVFARVAAEAGALAGDRPTTLLRFEDRGHVVVAAHGGPAQAGTAVPETPRELVDAVRRTAGPARIGDADGTGAEGRPAAGTGAAVGAPITVDGRLWGMLGVLSPDGPLQAATERRLAQFADIVAASIANAESRAQLVASRARVLATADETRRRMQRDVHDGAQQRLVQTVITLKLALRALGDEGGPGADLVAESLQHAERATAELRDLVRGILPGSLGRGLGPGIESLVADLPVVVDVRADVPRLPRDLETTAYFVVAEAMANVVKHADATRVEIDLRLDGPVLRLEVRDDGRGGADRARGTGLTGLFDRVEAGEGTLVIESPPGSGTTLRATLPVDEG